MGRLFKVVTLILLGSATIVSAQPPPSQPAPTADGQAGATLSGRLIHSRTQAPIADAIVTIDELKRQTRSDANGNYAFESVPPGMYHVSVRATGFVAERHEITVTAGGGSLEIAVTPEVHHTEIVTVIAGVRDPFELYQPTSVLAGQDLAKQLQSTLGAALATQPGVAERSFGPGPSRPVIRGLDGDRVTVLEDGQRSGDLSSQSSDHGVVVNPASAARIEVVRGPATLLHGANAVGGLVNVVTDLIPTTRLDRARGNVVFDLGSAAREGGAAADVAWGNNQWAVHLGAGGRRSGDVDTPEGEIDNTQTRSGFGNFGFARTGEKHYAGASYSYTDTKYGVPFIEGGQISLTPRRHTVAFRAGGTGLGGALDSYRATVSHRRYRHEELEGDEVGTSFENDTTEFELFAGHRAVGRLKGTVGGTALVRSFSAVGEEALSPPVDQNGVAAFIFEELTWPHATVQFGGRIDHARYDPEEDLPERDFTDFSGSVGLLLRPPAAQDHVTIALSLARASRAPALEELYFNGEHPGNFAIEIGNPDLESEHALGLDLALRWRHPRASGEIAYFRNDISNYIFREPTGDFEDDFPVIEFIAADSVLHGIEGHADVALTDVVFAELGLDYVRGRLKDVDEPLPRIPPLRVRAGLRYQSSAFQAGGEVVSVAKQDRIFGEETITDGYNLLKLFASYSFDTGGAVSTITARLDNATDELYRNHLSLIKDFVPEMGRNFKVLYSVQF